MKRLLATLLAATMSFAAPVAAEPIGDPFSDTVRPPPSTHTLATAEVIHYALPHLNRVARCYRTHTMSDTRATGELELYLVIANTGRVVFADISVPGVASASANRIERCLLSKVATWRFPQRKGFTNAVVPYHFLRSRHPITGPLPAPRPNA